MIFDFFAQFGLYQAQQLLMRSKQDKEMERATVTLSDGMRHYNHV